MWAFFKKSPFSTAERKILLLVTCAIILPVSAVFGIFYYYMTQAVGSIVLERSVAVFTELARKIPPQSLSNLSQRDDNANPLYETAHSILNSARYVTGVRYIYTAKRNAEGKAIYVVDGLDYGTDDFRHIGDLIEPEVLPQLDICLKGKPSHAQSVLRTSWGDILPACTPINEGDTTVGALVVEFSADEIAGSAGRAFSFSLIISLCLASAAIIITIRLLRRLATPFYRTLAYTDLLTGIQNRNAFELDIKALTASTVRGMRVLVCDLNDLKGVNDRLGHATGDAYIRALANLLAETFKNLGTVYRIGGDEFAVLLPASDHDPEALAANMYAKAAGIRTANWTLSFAYGLDIFTPERDKDLHDTLTHADAHMYAHKHRVKAAMQATAP